MTDYARVFGSLLNDAGITVGGDRPFDIRVSDPRAYRRCVAGGSIGLGESFMDGWWDCEALDEAFAKILAADLRHKIRLTPAMALDAGREALPNLAYVVPGLRPLLARFQSIWSTAETHYDVGNEFYAKLLDERMVYSCGYWENARTLEEGQLAKLELACRKMGLQPGMTVLDIGCGWGAFAKHAAETRGVKVVGVTISREQQRLAQERCAALPVEIRLADYREITGTFDRVVSFGMFEHVGRANFRKYLQVVHDRLTPNGLCLLETIGGDLSGQPCNPWFQKYIFEAPTSMFPSIAELSRAAEGLFTVEDWHNLGADYAPTLRGWAANLDAERQWVVARHGERFYRMWRFYLLTCAGAFASRTHQMWQIVFARHGVAGGYRWH